VKLSGRTAGHRLSTHRWWGAQNHRKHPRAPEHDRCGYFTPRSTPRHRV